MNSYWRSSGSISTTWLSVHKGICTTIYTGLQIIFATRAPVGIVTPKLDVISFSYSERNYIPSAQSVQCIVSLDCGSPPPPPPPPPGAFSVSVYAEGNDYITLQWSTPSGTVGGFRVYRDNVDIYDLPAGTQNYTDYTVGNGIPHYYYFDAYNSYGDSYTSQIEASAQGPPAAPTISTSGGGASQTVSLTMNIGTGSTGCWSSTGGCTTL